MSDPQTTPQIVLTFSEEMVEKCFKDFERDFSGKTPEEVGEEAFTKYMTERSMFYLKQNMIVTSEAGNA